MLSHMHSTPHQGVLLRNVVCATTSYGGG